MRLLGPWWLLSCCNVDKARGKMVRHYSTKKGHKRAVCIYLESEKVYDNYSYASLC
jgi:hypothetical protein